MGYRSNVVFVIRKDKFKILFDGISKEQQKLLRKLISESEDVRKKKDGIIINWMRIKWYDDDDAVSIFLKQRSKIDPVYWRFCRLGESIDDCEDSGSWFQEPFHIWIERTIQLDKLDTW